MEASGILMCCAFVSAFACAYMLASEAGRGLVKRRRLRESGSVVAGVGGFRDAVSFARNGCPLTNPLARVLLRSAKAEDLAAEMVLALEARGIKATRHGALSSFLALVVLGALVVSLASFSVVCGIAVAACACAIAVIRLKGFGESRRFALRQAVPDALNSMQVCFQSGYSLMQTFQQVASETKGPLGGLFLHGAHQLQTGATAAETLESLRQRASIPELSFVAVALDVQHQAGGSMREVLDSARAMIEDELELSRKLRIQTAQAKLSARVVTVIPFVLIAVFSLVSEDFLAPFFESAAGFALLFLACGMQVLGVLLVRRMLKVKE